MAKRNYERGILGVKKDPANPVLFSFAVRQGDECPSSDADDSDYLPSENEEVFEEIEWKKNEISRSKNKSPKKKRLKKDSAVKVRKKKAPRNRIISSDESSDSDNSYCNNGTFTAVPVLDTENKSTCIPKLRITSQAKTGEQTVDKWGQWIPAEILLKIFSYVVGSQGALPFLVRSSRVCNLWYSVSRTPSLWECLDLSYGWIKCRDSTLHWLQQHRMKFLKELNLSKWSNLTDNGIRDILENHPELESLNISSCKKLTATTSKLVAEKLSNLKKLDISFSSNTLVSGNVLKPVLMNCGPTLEYLSVSGNHLVGFNSVLTAISENCPRLHTFDVSNCRFSSDFVSLNIEKLQEGCPQIQILRMTNSKFRAATASLRAQAESAGFPELQELSIAINSDTYGSTMGANTGLGMDGAFLYRILKNSHNLQLLDVRGCTHLSIQDLRTLPVVELQYLYVSKCSIAKYPGLDTLINKWCHSLLDVDLSWNGFQEGVLEAAVAVLVDAGNQGQLQLHTLNLAGTGISEQSVRLLVSSCSSLKSLNLNSCRGLPRGWKTNYEGKDLIKFKKSIRQSTPLISDSDDYDDNF